ncbi:MAG TPA: DUF2249 domain-containing protein [Polaromonas sp.]|uniref:DUF2249 domain-containing protein n=1 Tax=Polaromonas sp. TaxID=1869339 RepID=UPI002D59C5A2|nr:DUF2249 domain-containing protein [Polaromonas sp.]HYW58172.1 DUF2249 domain-containing protein [Polaromonas sp.]
MSHASATSTLDIRTIPPRERHPAIFSTLGQLGTGQTLELINDHDPQPLNLQLQAEMPGKFDWSWLEQGPDTWRVTITRRASTHSDGQCCGSCGGA